MHTYENVTHNSFSISNILIKSLLGFGGLYGTRSKYGDMDITGDGAIEFFTNRIKITSKWPVPSGVPEYAMGLEQQNEQVPGGGNATVDHANFAGRM